jgi:hypothetical protein
MHHYPGDSEVVCVCFIHNRRDKLHETWLTELKSERIFLS